MNDETFDKTFVENNFLRYYAIYFSTKQFFNEFCVPFSSIGFL